MRQSRGRVSRAVARRAGKTAVFRPRPLSKRAETLLRQLREALEAADVKVRHERLLREVGYHPRSGLCRVGEQRVLLIDHELDAEAQMDLCLDTLERVGVRAEALPDPARALFERREPAPAPAVAPGVDDGAAG